MACETPCAQAGLPLSCLGLFPSFSFAKLSFVSQKAWGGDGTPPQGNGGEQPTPSQGPALVTIRSKPLLRSGSRSRGSFTR